MGHIAHLRNTYARKLCMIIPYIDLDKKSPKLLFKYWVLYLLKNLRFLDVVNVYPPLEKHFDPSLEETWIPSTQGCFFF